MKSNKISGFLALMKPSIMLLVLITGAAGLVLEGSLLVDPLRFTLVLVLLGLAGGSANSFNQYFEREIDSRMSRTRKRRPLPMKILLPAEALWFSVITGLLSVVLFWYFFNTLSAVLALGTIVFYSLFYTLYLKPRTHLNIVIGGAAGAMGPVIAWAAASGKLSLIPLLLFAIIFFWTPSHFWSLALCMKEDYRKASYPMLPLVVGDKKTWKQILLYTLITLVFSATLPLLGSGMIYILTASVTGWLFIRKAVRARKKGTLPEARELFAYSIIYLLVLFTSMIVDHAILS